MCYRVFISSHIYSLRAHVCLCLYDAPDGSGDFLCGDGIRQGEEECDCGGVPQVLFYTYSCTHTRW